MVTLLSKCGILYTLLLPCGIQSTSGNDCSADPFQSPIATQRRQKGRNSSLELRESSDLAEPSLEECLLVKFSDLNSNPLLLKTGTQSSVCDQLIEYTANLFHHIF